MKSTFSLLAFVALAFILTGCGSKSASTASPTAVSSADSSSQSDAYNPQQFSRMILIDPVLYKYLSQGTSNDLSNTTTPPSKEEQAKIGLQGNLRSSEKYGISGTAKVISSDEIQISNFSFNGACTPLQFSLIRTSQPEKPLVKVYEISAASSGKSFKIPTLNTRLTSFDGIGLYCADTPTKAISTTAFQ